MKGVTCPALLDPERPGAPSPGQWENLSVQSLLGTTLVVWSCPHCCCGFQYKQKILHPLGPYLNISSAIGQKGIYMCPAEPTEEQIEVSLCQGGQAAVYFPLKLQEPSKAVKVREKKWTNTKTKTKAWKNRFPQSPTPWAGREDLNQVTTLTENPRGRPLPQK